jgi:hypothetical protein
VAVSFDGRECLAVVQAAFGVDPPRTGGTADSAGFDLAFVQYFSPVFGEDTSTWRRKCHPHVPSCDYVALYGAPGIISPAGFIRPVRLVPHVEEYGRCLTTRQKREAERVAGDAGIESWRSTPRYFALPAPL